MSIGIMNTNNPCCTKCGKCKFYIGGTEGASIVCNCGSSANEPHVAFDRIVQLEQENAELKDRNFMVENFHKVNLENAELKKQLEDQNTKLSKLSYSTLNTIARDIEEYDDN